MSKQKIKVVRKRPRQSRSKDTFEVILEAAAEVLESDGFAGYNTNAVADRAGVSVGSVYQYFPNKDALTIVLIERETSLLLKDVEAASALDDKYAAVSGLVNACVHHQMRRPALARLLDLEEARLPIQGQNRNVIDRLRQACVESAAGFPASEDYGADLAAADVVAMIRGMADAAGDRGETDMLVLRARIERAVFGYLRQHMNSKTPKS
ncbi:AcrR family transcriptional regulator [Rhodanobacter sp. K2T2]|uniref:TetR/AcrR family transcriptional regulator n=1 Tax=Rhodanobacter sp. K2T2 TaxID=2723085 RepID=UPI0015CB901D|nr:TetR/AcrR family transcriptional regulator [Rhodanobacter sp. K2T2]NYE27617.1 AcrR family transcriptional regulator [Rhodanobacter sp. K2T2]